MISVKYQRKIFLSPWDVESSLRQDKSYWEEDVGGRKIGKGQEQQGEEKGLLVCCLEINKLI